MFTLILSFLLVAPYADMPKKDLTINEILGVIGKPVSVNAVLSGVNIVGIKEDEADEFLFKINNRITDPKQFSFLGLEVERSIYSLIV